MTAAGARRIQGRKHKPIAWIAACSLLAVLGVARLTEHLREVPPPAGAARQAPVLGAGSAVALPFGQAGVAPATVWDDAAGWARGLPPPPGVPRPVARLGSESIRHALDRLGSMARSGDGQAAFDAYEIAQFCAAAGVFQRSLVMLPADTDDTLRTQLHTQAQAHARMCEGATPAQLGERFAHVRIAAEGGVTGAAEQLLDAGLPGQAPWGDAADPAAAQWREHAIELVRRDGLNGDVGALTALGSLYQSGQLVAQDPAQALLYQLAALEIMKSRPQSFSVPEMQMQQQFAQVYQSQVPGQTVDAIQKAALDIAARCCSAAN